METMYFDIKDQAGTTVFSGTCPDGDSHRQILKLEVDLEATMLQMEHARQISHMPMASGDKFTLFIKRLSS